MTLSFRPLRADEIDLRIQTVKENGLSLLLYKDARADQTLLDESVGSLNWKKSYHTVNGNLFCTVSIWDDDKSQWIDKSDVGVASFAEPVKGEASDAFKRACFCFGIGRELYSSPFVWIPESKCNIRSNDRGKFTCYDHFIVEQILYDDNKRIVALSIRNTTKKCRAYCVDMRPEKKTA